MNTGKFIMALDAGTTSNRCIIFDYSGNIVSVAQKEFTQYYPYPGWVEHDPDEIWKTQAMVMLEALLGANLTADDIAAVGITNQRETTVVWDRQTGKPVYNAIVWQCRRTADICESLEEYRDMIVGKTGLIPDPYFSGTKIKWILDNVEGAKEKAIEGKLLFGTIETWLIWKLTGGRVHVTDCSNASRTMLFNINEMRWDEEILRLLDIPKCMLPKVVSNSEIYGYTNNELFGCAIPISGAAGDQQSALFGQKCFLPGEAKNTYGTGCFMLMNTGGTPIFSKNGLVSTVAWKIGNEVSYALEGSVFVGGASVQWLRDELKIISSADECEEMALQVPDTAGCYVVPAFTGLGAPYWDPQARGTIVGLTRGVNRNHIVRATLDSIAYQVNDVLEAMKEDSGLTMNTLKVDGGASRNGYLMNTQAGISNVEVVRPANVETTALGAAYLAGLAVGYWNGIDELGAGDDHTSFLPEMTEEERRRNLKNWHRAVERARSWEE